MEAPRPLPALNSGASSPPQRLSRWVCRAPTCPASSQAKPGCCFVLFHSSPHQRPWGHTGPSFTPEALWAHALHPQDSRQHFECPLLCSPCMDRFWAMGPGHLWGLICSRQGVRRAGHLGIPPCINTRLNRALWVDLWKSHFPERTWPAEQSGCATPPLWRGGSVFPEFFSSPACKHIPSTPVSRVRRKIFADPCAVDSAMSAQRPRQTSARRAH